MLRAYAFLGFLLLILLLLPFFLSQYLLGIFVFIFYYAYLGQSPWKLAAQ